MSDFAVDIDLPVDLAVTVEVADNSISVAIDIPGEGTLNIDTSSPPVAILDVFGSSAIDVSQDSERDLDAFWKTKISDMDLLLVKFPDGPTSWAWHAVDGGGDGYNYNAGEITAMGFNIATFQDGIGLIVNDYDFFEDYVNWMADVGAEAVIMLNPIPPILTGSFTAFFTELAYIVSRLTVAGVPIRRFAIGTELGLSSIAGVFTAPAVYKTAGDTICAHCVTNYPTVKRSGWTYMADDLTQFHPTWEAVVEPMNVHAWSQYFEVSSAVNTWQGMIDRIITDLPNQLDLFEGKYPGKKLVFEQVVIQLGNIFRLKTGEGLWYCLFNLRINKENAARSDLVTDVVHYSMNRWVADNNVVFPAYHIMKLFRPMSKNDGRVVVTFDEVSGSSVLYYEGISRNGNIEIYVLNLTANPVPSGAIRINGERIAVNAESYYCDLPTDSAFLHETLTAVESVTFRKYSGTVITYIPT